MTNTIMMVILAGIVFMSSSCKKDGTTKGSGNPVITGIRAYKASPHDSVLTKANPGDYVVLQGSHLTGITAVYFDGTKAAVNTALGSDVNFPVVIPANIPFATVTNDQLNTIVVTTATGTVTYKFPITAPAPHITAISNEMANAGDVITLSGTGLFALTSVTFPGNIAATTFNGGADGSQAMVTVPAGVTTSGPLVVTTKYGTSTSVKDAVLNDNADVLLNFDDKNGFTPWSALPLVVSSVSNPAIKANRGKFLYWNAKGITAGSYYVGDLATPTDGSQLAYPTTISSSEPAANLAVKFEVNIPVGMSSGEIDFDVNYSHTYAWSPWLINGSTRVTVVTNGWQTITIPLSSFPGISTYNDIKGQPIQLFYVNNGSGITQDVNIGFDNFRIVKIK
ncbi:glycan-binding surface protein [Mucilaginibacter pocheonensis]|uniref:Surface glycan-binding protein B xyloglucan binding domain-containing protein n=1 Tax=Mucilaginibacter pocheonensis TaxID=398050 RepID=A0ABU1TH90_9SPHI|nr:glycan-binding surface protein [Mucilaginibacter pocheonensis]MDR6944732.1 hypothetical protein [Mucilaginibacter pocheonensis]